MQIEHHFSLDLNVESNECKYDQDGSKWEVHST